MYLVWIRQFSEWTVSIGTHKGACSNPKISIICILQWKKAVYCFRTAYESVYFDLPYAGWFFFVHLSRPYDFVRRHKWFIVSVNWNSPWSSHFKWFKLYRHLFECFSFNVYFWFLVHCAFSPIKLTAQNVFNAIVQFFCFASAAATLFDHFVVCLSLTCPPIATHSSSSSHVSSRIPFELTVFRESLKSKKKKCSWPCQIWI